MNTLRGRLARLEKKPPAPRQPPHEDWRESLRGYFESGQAPSRWSTADRARADQAVATAWAEAEEFFRLEAAAGVALPTVDAIRGLAGELVGMALRGADLAAAEALARQANRGLRPPPNFGR